MDSSPISGERSENERKLRASPAFGVVRMLHDRAARARSNATTVRALRHVGRKKRRRAALPRRRRTIRLARADPALHATWADALEKSYRVRELPDDAEAAELPCLQDLVAVAAVAVAGLGIGRTW